MSRPGALPILQQIALDLLAPPIITAIWWLLSKGWTRVVGTENNVKVQGWIDGGWKYVLAILYVVMLTITTYAYFTSR